MKELPPLPEMNLWFQGMPVNPEAFQSVMREYGALCRRMALEEAIKVCDDFGKEYYCQSTTSEITDAIKGLK